MVESGEDVANGERRNLESEKTELTEVAALNSCVSHPPEPETPIQTQLWYSVIFEPLR